MKRGIVYFGLFALLGLAFPLDSLAVQAHPSVCSDCHRPGANPRLMTNLCTNCHDGSLNGGPGQFDASNASNAMGKHPAPSNTNPGDQTSHFWGGSTTAQTAAGAVSPPKAFYFSRYGISTNRVTCTICHDPHKDVGTKLTRAATADDLICQQCHTGFYVDLDNHALKTHPVGVTANYAAALGAKPDMLRPEVTNTGSGSVALVNGNVSCTSCHATHFVDSDSSTVDGIDGTLAVGDGHLLRADGPTKGERSALCQACHPYATHGNPAIEPNSPPDYVDNDAVSEQVGCLVCHGGHDPNPSPNYFMLRKQTTTAAYGTKNTLYSTYPNDWTAYCVACHGPVTSYKARNHMVGENCKGCHDHKAGSYSFAMGDNPTICGDCHGSPPRANVVATRNGEIEDPAGYALGADGTSYATAGQNFKDESVTPHKLHAGALNADKAATDYAFGSVGSTIVFACLPCHSEQQSGATHDTGTSAGSFQDVVFNNMAKANGVLTPVYKKTTGGVDPQWSCTNVYCHTNGGKRNSGGTKVLADYKVAVTKAWTSGSSPTIVGTATECQQCHGENTTSMASGQKNNSPTHQLHLARLVNNKTICYLCHSDTVTSAGVVPSTARDHRNGAGGKHVNGTVNVVFNTTGFNTALLGAAYSDPAQGICSVYCHNPRATDNAGSTPDWDNYTGVDLACDACHEGKPGVNTVVIDTGAHARHLTDATGPQLTCADCHGANADTFAHTGHVDGVVTYKTPGAGFNNICEECHGWETGDMVLSWWNPLSKKCATCHAGSKLSTIKGKLAPAKSFAATNGHNATSAYASGNPAASKDCSDCHSTALTGHFDADSTDKLLTAAGSDCLVCHGPTGTAVNKNIKPHMAKACIACHDPHGTANWEMIYTSAATQNVKDISATGKFTAAATIAFTARTSTDSFDEPGAAAGANNDDLCATCHTAAAGSDHNNRGGTGTHSDGYTHEGEDCFDCHVAHNDSGGNAFKAGAGTACNQCHGNPPPTGAHRNGPLLGDPELHSITGLNTTAEPRQDCARCHTGADSYTYDPAVDRTPAGGSLNHGNKTGRRTILAGTVGYTRDIGTNHWYCATACHNASATDGFWYTWAGSDEGILAKDRTPVDTALNCNACHYKEDFPTRANNDAALARALQGSHNKHFDKLKVCADCHEVRSDTTHITTSGANDLAKITGRAQAQQDEATLDFTTPATKYTINAGNTCTNTANNGLDCHATGAPTWGSAGPLACIACHTDKTTSAVNPTSGLHGVTPLVSGKQHDESFTYPGGTAVCTTCHTASPTVTATDHQNGTLDATRGAAGNTKIRIDATIGYVDGVAPTCAPSLAGPCHYEQPTKITDWKRKWHEGAADNKGACAGCHGDWLNGWNDNTTHDKTNKARQTHGVKGKTWECSDCHALESTTLQPYPFTIGTNDWRPNAGENTTLHGNGVINVNDNGTQFQRVGPISGCPECHTYWQTDGKHKYDVTEWPLTTITGDAPTVTCATCHGGLEATGANEVNWWPDQPGNDATQDNAGRHSIHMRRLAKMKYNEDFTALLTDNVNGTAFDKQKYLCGYCHAKAGTDTDHGDIDFGLPAEVFVADAVRSSKTLWDTVDGDATYTSGNCSSIECHNGKATATTATFDWYGAGTGNCALCHNNITDTTAGTTGATHQAHLAAPTFGKVITCANCHGGNPSWSGYTVPDPNQRLHINGTFAVAGGSIIDGTIETYTGVYTNYATRTAGDCGTNLCHNDGKDAPPYKNALLNYNWGTAFGACTACHRTDFNLGSSHNPHMNAAFATTFGRTAVGCGECHDAVSSSDMTAMTNHMNGSVNIKTGINYTGNVNVATAASYGTCANACHQDGKGVNRTSPAWNRTASATDNCTICHSSNAGTTPYPATGRHSKHVANTAYVTLSCGSCHANATASTIGGTTHINATANTGVNITAHTAGAADCTNNCHVVNTARGDWNDSDVLACLDCHVAGKVAATAGALPTSGLHAVTPRVSGKKHDQTLNVANGCEYCHTNVRAATTTHIKGDFTADGPSNNDRGLATFGAYSDATPGTCSGAGVNSAAGCHRDNGEWARKWDTTVANSDGAECANCHGGIGTGYGASAWNGGIVPDHLADWDTSGTPKVMTSHSVCRSCHGFAGAANKDANYDLTNLWNQGGADTSMHGNSKITMNGGTQYNEGNFGCDNAGCHGNAATGKRMADSGWQVELGAFAAGGSCFGCHGNGSNQYWPDGPDGGLRPDRGGKHFTHVQHIAEKKFSTTTPDVAQMNSTCDYCHPTGLHTGDQDNSPANVMNTDSDENGTPDLDNTEYFKRLVDPKAKGADTAGFYRSTSQTCSKVACHASAPFTPHWYADSVAPGKITDLEVQTNPEPGTVKLVWNAPGNDGYLDGTAYRYDVRWSTSLITDANFASANQAEAPTVHRMQLTGTTPKNQEVILTGLPSGTLYFAVKTYDEPTQANPSGNGSLVSNSPSGTAQVDNIAPIFWGVTSVAANDYNYSIAPNPDTNSVNVSWEAGRDHSHSLSTPLNYLVLWSTASLRKHFSDGGAMPATIGTDACFNKSTTPATPITCGTGGSNEYRIKSAQTSALSYNVTNLPVGIIYNFLVRATDGTNVDTNRAELMAMAKSTAYLPITLSTLYTSVAIPTATTGWTGGLIATSPATASASNAQLGAAYPGTQPTTFTLAQNGVIVWSPTTTFSVNTNVWGLNYQIKLGASTVTSAITLNYQFGYLTGNTFTPFGAARSYILSRRAVRVVKFPLSTYKGTVPAGSKPAFVLKNMSATGLPINYGSTANKGGILLFNQQEYNDLPTGLANLSQTQVANTFVGGPVYRLTWDAADAVNAGQTIHYDVLADVNNANTWQYVVGRNLTTNTVDWDPVGDGITGNPSVRFKVLAGDGYRTGLMYNNDSLPADSDNVNHSEVISAPFSVNNSVDVWAPAAIGSSDNGPGTADDTADDLKVETRPKQGSVYLTWKAVGNDGFNHGTRATQYDIRFSTSPIGSEATFDALPAANRASNEPYPDFTGAVEGYELLGLNPDATYYFAMKVGDQAGNWSGLSNVVSTDSGPQCGICHSTPPDEGATAGNHIVHGYTKNDCGNCHGSEAASYDVDHQDGLLKLGFKTANPVEGDLVDAAGTVTYTQGSTVIYTDTNGVGGFNETSGGVENPKKDSGTCSGFAAPGVSASGCHGPASPTWNAAATLACSACHGRDTRTTGTATEYYNGRDYDATLDNNMVVPDQIKAAPPTDNHGTSTGKYVGAHLKHLNSSFRLAKGDNCKLCHNNNVHADGTVDVAYDLNVTGSGALWTPEATGVGTAGTCAGTNELNCHGTNTPTWDSAATVACNECHGFKGKTYPVGSAPTINGGAGVIAHVSDGNVVRACTWCHSAGHPQGTLQDVNSIMIPNNPTVGVAYRSGGIHLLKNINGRGAKTTEAEVCWTCHDAQPTKVTEWAANNDANTGSTPYNYGNLFTSFAGSTFSTPTSNWLGSGTGAYWQSGTAVFQTIKAGKIQSTHSTNPLGTSAVGTYDATNKRYNETRDAVADIRCSNCHDVHNMNKADNDTVIGTPYLRGTWMGNPYQEDGPPLSTTTYAGVAIGSYNFGAIPRGGTNYRRLGGYFIDQNNVVPGTATQTTMATLDDYPTAGWTMESSAGLCILCHSNDVDNMDQTPGENLWLGANGHSNSAIGGTFTNSVNIFDTKAGTSSLSGRPISVFTTSYQGTTQVPDMAYQMQPNSPSTTRGYGYRGRTDGAGYLPQITTDYAHYAYDWGATVDSDTVDQMYHQFSCSKCHNPHASRLPKLLITNCLDVQHNTWTTARAAQNSYSAAALTDVDRGWTAAYYASAQNCHRYNNKRTAANKGGWNKVSPWTTPNQ